MPKHLLHNLSMTVVAVTVEARLWRFSLKIKNYDVDSMTVYNTPTDSYLWCFSACPWPIETVMYQHDPCSEGRVPHLGVRAWPARRKKGRAPHLGVCTQPARRKKGRAPLGTQRNHLLRPRHGRVATTSAMPSSFVDAPSHPRPRHRAAPPRQPQPWPPVSSSSAQSLRRLSEDAYLCFPSAPTHNG